MASLLRNGRTNKVLLPWLKWDLRGPGSQAPAVSLSTSSDSPSLAPGGRRGFLPLSAQ